MRNRQDLFRVLIASLLVVWTVAAAAELSVPSVIGSHMVLQQGKDVPIWGKADPGAEVTVSMAGQHRRTEADADGKWRVTLDPLRAGGPHTMRIESGKEDIAFQDVLVGEVWVCSGQSNMQWTVNNSNNAVREIAAADYPEIRLFYVKRTVASEPKEDCEAKWEVCTPTSIPEFSAVAYFFGRELHKDLEVPIGLIHTSWGGTPAESWTSHESLDADPMLSPIVERWQTAMDEYPKAMDEYNKKLARWEKAVKRARKRERTPPNKPWPPQGPDHPWRPSGLYNAMIMPLVPYAIQGAIWYQGESNAGRAYQYRTLFPRMIQDWRDVWGQGAFPFLFVQLASFTERLDEPGDSDWAELREAQLMTLDLKNTGMAVTVDIGDHEDIHPRNKQEVGRRLALNALAKTYGKDIAYSGPIYQTFERKENTIVIHFDHTNDGLQAYGRERLSGFSIAGPDGKFVWANAQIDGNKVIVSSPEVSEPTSVRYGWANNPDCNLHNGAGLPASPFRLDPWPGITVDAR